MIKTRADSPGSGTSVRPAKTSAFPMGPCRPVATGPTNTMAQPRLQTQSSTSTTDAFPGLGPENQHKGADGSTPSAKQQVLTTRLARARGTSLGGAVERGAAEASENEAQLQHQHRPTDSGYAQEQIRQGQVWPLGAVRRGFRTSHDASSPRRRRSHPHHGTARVTDFKRDKVN